MKDQVGSRGSQTYDQGVKKRLRVESLDYGESCRSRVDQDDFGRSRILSRSLLGPRGIPSLSFDRTWSGSKLKGLITKVSFQNIHSTRLVQITALEECFECVRSYCGTRDVLRTEEYKNVYK